MERSAQNAFAVEYARNIRDNDPGMGMAKIWYKYQQDFRSERSVLGRDQFLTLLTNEGVNGFLGAKDKLFGRNVLSGYKSLYLGDTLAPNDAD